MNINSSNNYAGVFAGMIPKEYTLSSSEIDWITRACEQIKVQKGHRNLELTLADQVQKLNSFEPEKIIFLVDILRKVLDQEKNQHKSIELLTKQVASLINEKGSKLFYPYLSKTTPLTVDLAIEQAKTKEQNPLYIIPGYKIDFTSKDSVGKNAIVAIFEASMSKGFEMWRVSADKFEEIGLDAHSPEGQAVIIELVKMSAKQNSWRTAENIHQFGILTSTAQGRQGLIEIAELIADMDGYCLSDNIQGFGFQDFPDGQKILIELAMRSAKQSGKFTSKCIKNYHIDATQPEGQKRLYEIAKIAAIQDGGGTSEFIQEYGISGFIPGEDMRIEIAKIAAQNDGKGTSRFIEQYNIDRSTDKGQKALIEIAKLAAQQNGGGCSQYIQDYRIKISAPEGKKAMLEILKLAVQQNASESCRWIENFLLDPDTAETILHDDVEVELFNFIFNEIVNQMKDFSSNTLVHNFQKYNHFRSLSGYSIEPTVFRYPLSLLSKGDISGAIKDCFEICAKKFLMPKSELEWLQKSVDNKEKFTQTKLLKWFMTTATLCASRKDLIEGFKAKQDIFKDIAKQYPTLREALIKQFMHVYHIQNIDNWHKLIEATEGIAHVKLASLVFANFPQEGQEVYTKALLTLKKEREFREGKYQKLLLETLIKIEKSTLESSEKISLIANLFEMPAATRLQAMALVSDILAFQGDAYLKAAKDIAALKSFLEKLFKNKFNVKIENFADSYEMTIGRWRSKEALITYAGKLMELPESMKRQALPCFQKLLEQILQGSFEKDRYDVENNPHMAFIQENFPDLFDKWQLSESLEASEMILGDTEQVIPLKERVMHTLKQALEQNHLGGEQQVHLYPHISACLANWEKLEENLALLNQEIVPLTGRRLTQEEILRKQSLLLQKKILELIQQPQALEKQLNALKSLAPQNSVFFQDVEDSINILQAPSEKTAAYQVIDSHDPNHFLLMGTEVLNSCQNVNGSPSLNVCLLGYFMDGKHRLGLICDEQGKIWARSVFRLLIDSKGNPVLFQEKMYFADASPEYPQLLRKLALKKAASLGIPLVVSRSDFEEEEASKYPHEVEAKDKPVPFEYVDAKNGIESGPYVIDNPLQIKVSKREASYSQLNPTGNLYPCRFKIQRKECKGR